MQKEHHVEMLRQEKTVAKNKTVLKGNSGKKISWVWWHMPIIPATKEAEAGESLQASR